MSKMAQPEKPAEPQVVIDGRFVRDQAREAIHQFFRPITAPFESKRSEPEKKGAR